MKKITILLILLVLCSSRIMVAQLTSTLAINTGTKYQKVTGFGAVGMYSSSISGGWQNYITANQIDSLYGPNGIGLNIFRVSLPYSAYSTTGNNWYTYCNTAPRMNNMVDAVKRVKLHGGIVLASPWSPPLAFKDTLTKGGWYYGTAANYDFKTTLTGGTISYRNYNSLLDARYADYATFLNSFVTYMNSQSASIDIISVQNEPDYVFTDAACYWTGPQLLKFVKEQGATVKGTTGVKLMAGETTYFEATRRTTYTDPILNDLTANAVTDYVAGHVYGNGADIDYPLARNAGKEVWMTEHAFGSENNIEPTWADQILFATEIHNCMAVGNYSAYLSWYARRYYSFLNDGAIKFWHIGKYTKRAFVMAQFAKYMTGKTHVKTTLTTSDTNLKTSAYLTANADSLIVIAVNGGNNTHNLTVNMPFSVTSAYRVVTTSSANLVSSTVTLSNSLTPVVEVPAQSITSFVFSKNQLTLPAPGPADVDAEDNDSTMFRIENLVYTSSSTGTVASTSPANASNQTITISSTGAYQFWGNSNVNSAYVDVTAFDSLKVVVKTKSGIGNFNLKAGMRTTAQTDAVTATNITSNFLSTSGTFVIPFNSGGTKYTHLFSIKINSGGTNVANETMFIEGIYLVKKKTSTGINDIQLSTPDNYMGNLYSIDGRLVRLNLTSKQDLIGIQPGIYILNKRKIVLPLLKQN